MPRIRLVSKEKISFVNKRSGPNNTIDLDKPDDLTLETKKIGTKKVFIETQINEYPKFTNNLINASSYDGNGNGDVFVDANNGTDNNLLQEYERKSENKNATTILNQYSNSGQLNLENDNFKIKKRLSDSDSPSMIDIVTDIESNLDKASFPKRIKKIVSQQSINSELNKYLNNNASIDSKSEKLLDVAFVQNTFGKHIINQNEINKIKLNDLKKIGMWTLFEGTGEYYIPENPGTGEEAFTTLAPGIARLGQRINTSKFQPINVYKKHNPNFSKPSANSFVEGNKLSYGNVNNYAVRFHGLDNKASVALASLFIITIGGLIKGLAELIGQASIGDYNNSNSTPIITNQEERHKRLGHYIIPKQKSLIKRLGLDIKTLPTTNPFNECLDRGLLIFSNLGYNKSYVETFSSLGISNLTSLVGLQSNDPVS
jgi:viroplasmin and RNaseH domain-containing protein